MLFSNHTGASVPSRAGGGNFTPSALQTRRRYVTSEREFGNVEQVGRWLFSWLPQRPELKRLRFMAEKQFEKEPGAKDDGPQRILLVDDDHEIIESMRLALESRGYQILVARDGNQGLAMAEREDPDLLILDMMMPTRSGLLVLERLRASRAVPMRVITITAN